MYEQMINLLKNITGFMTCFVPGYIFISCFNFASCRKRDSDVKYVVINSIAISFFIRLIIQLLRNHFNWSSFYLQILMFLTSVIGGLIIGRVVRTEIINSVSVVLFKRDIESNQFIRLWEEANKSDCVVYATINMKKDSVVFEGQIKRINIYASDLEIILAYFCVTDNKKGKLEDNHNNDKVFAMINYSNIDSFKYELVPALEEASK